MINGILRYDMRPEHVTGYTKKGKFVDFISARVSTLWNGKECFYDGSFDISDWDAAVDAHDSLKRTAEQETMEKVVLVEAIDKKLYQRPFMDGLLPICGKLIQPTIVDIVLKPFGFVYYKFHIGSASYSNMTPEEIITEVSDDLGFAHVRSLRKVAPFGGYSPEIEREYNEWRGGADDYDYNVESELKYNNPSVAFTSPDGDSVFWDELG